MVVKLQKSVDYRVKAKIFEKLLDFGSENPKNAGYLYEGINPMEIVGDSIHKKFT
ncbi:MAG: hypothetical protein IJY93_04315 [Clostridia bacterium]|nr:hypothetical protein [Clostridia bacterium]